MPTILENPTDYPKKTCGIDSLVTHPKLVEAARAGRKTQQRRNGLYAYPGEIFKLDGDRFKVTRVERRRVGDMTDVKARAEGYPSNDAYKDLIPRMHKGMVWDDEALVWVHCFEKISEKISETI